MDKYIEDLDYDMERDDMIAKTIHPMMPPMGNNPSMNSRMDMDSSEMEMPYTPSRAPMGRSHMPEAPYMSGESHVQEGPYMPYMNQMPMMQSMEHMDMDEMRYMEHMNEYMTAMYHAEACRMRAMQYLKK